MAEDSHEQAKLLDGQVPRPLDPDVSNAVVRCVALQLPKEVSRRVFSQLDCQDLVNCASVCRQWYTESEELIQGWKEEYKEVCYLRGLALRGLAATPGSFTARAQFEAYLAGSPD